MDDTTIAVPARCDWLDVTYPSDSGLTTELCDFLGNQGCLPTRSSSGKLEYRHSAAEWGNFQLLESTRGWSRVSASGGSLEALRLNKQFDDYLGIIGSHPHTVTRVDAALDRRVPAPPLVRELVERYPPDSRVHLTRKGIQPDYYLKPGLDGGMTGTFYAGPLRSRTKVSARVYDKQQERFDRAGLEVGPWIRYEVTVRKGVGATLRDAQNPTSLFWHFASPALLPLPPGIPDWDPSRDEPWAPGAFPSDPYLRLRRRVETSADLEMLAEFADSVGTDGRLQLLRLVRNRLGLREVSIK